MSQPSFEIGLCMAGAVSAGAYTAGVMDYLIDSLEKWEQAKQTNDASVPRHNVRIAILSGASAGGMTAAITSAAIHNNIPPIAPQWREDELYKQKNKFYNTWVNLTNNDMIPVMLSTGDLLKGKKARSLLNSNFIDDLAETSLKIDAHPQSIIQRNYFASDLELLVSLSNIVGIPYELGFISNARVSTRYKTKAHGDYGHFIINNATDAAANANGRIPLSFINNLNTEILKSCAMATGAFPIGLSPRAVNREKSSIENNPILNRHYNSKEKKLNISNPYVTINIDGGMIDNEPFSITRNLLLQRTGETDGENKDYMRFKSCVWMIDPFPSEEGEKEFNYERAFDLDRNILNIIRTMRSQLIFKPSEIEEALDPNNASRFMVAPKRTTNGVSYHGSKAIASGSLGGFGGFINKNFRIHDYYLGRRNCQHFLRQRFTIPFDDGEQKHTVTNPIFKEGYGNPEAIARFITKDGNALPIIPDMEYHVNNPFAKEETYIGWPEITKKEIDRIKPFLKTRIEKVMLSLTPKSDRTMLWLGSRLFLRKRIADAALNWITDELSRHNLPVK
jgi:hypothetical protein